MDVDRLHREAGHALQRRIDGVLDLLSHLSDGKTKQFLFATSLQSHYGGGTTPYVHWVGDLDRDGKADFLLDLPDDNCGYDDRLYLSSLATGTAFVAKAAQLSGREAACGC